MVSNKIQILTPFQKEFLYNFGKERISENFFMTGGTALSVFYLQHRYSEDIDFFTRIDGEIERLIPAIELIAKEIKVNLDIKRLFPSFLECYFYRNDEKLILHFAQDAPFRLKPTIKNPEYNVFVDNELDIACNKFSALFDRSDAKDFVDIYFLSKEFMNYWEIFEYAKKKYFGMDEYWLAVAMKQVHKIEALPRMIKPVTVEALKEFYDDKIKRIMDSIKSVRI